MATFSWNGKTRLSFKHSFIHLLCLYDHRSWQVLAFSLFSMGPQALICALAPRCGLRLRFSLPDSKSLFPTWGQRIPFTKSLLAPPQEPRIALSSVSTLPYFSSMTVRLCSQNSCSCLSERSKHNTSVRKMQVNPLIPDNWVSIPQSQLSSYKCRVMYQQDYETKCQNNPFPFQ